MVGSYVTVYFIDKVITFRASSMKSTRATRQKPKVWVLLDPGRAAKVFVLVSLEFGGTGTSISMNRRSLLLLRSQFHLWGLPFWVRFLRMWQVFFFFFFNPTIEAVTFRLRGWCWVRFCCRHSPVRICEPVRWNACVHTLDLGSYSHPEQLFFFLGNGVRTHVNSNGKVPCTGCSGERAQHTANWAILAPNGRSEDLSLSCSMTARTIELSVSAS